MTGTEAEPVRDHVTERSARLDEAHARYMEAWQAAHDDLREAQQAAWSAYQARLSGILAEYLQTVDHIRNDVMP